MNRRRGDAGAVCVRIDGPRDQEDPSPAAREVSAARRLPIRLETLHYQALTGETEPAKYRQRSPGRFSATTPQGLIVLSFETAVGLNAEPRLLPRQTS